MRACPSRTARGGRRAAAPRFGPYATRPYAVGPYATRLYAVGPYATRLYAVGPVGERGAFQ